MDKNNKQQRIDAIMIDDGATLIDALQQMDKASSKLLIVTREQKFYSLVSIGDLQRAMIAYQSFSKKISEILRPIIALLEKVIRNAIKCNTIRPRSILNLLFL